ncbi:MAG TPA: hypothetical protein VK563_12935, partial [Puia sp.]|nr:hypothetical protein [Puia sp.]
LGASLGITLIATGFEHKDPFMKSDRETIPVPKKEEKIIMTLANSGEEQKLEKRPVLPADIANDSLNTKEAPEKEQATLASLPDALQPRLVDAAMAAGSGSSVSGNEGSVSSAPRIEWVLEPMTSSPVASSAPSPSPSSATSGGYLARPSNIYAEEPRTEKQSSPEPISPVKEPVLRTTAPDRAADDEANPDMQLVFRETSPTADEPRAHQTHVVSVANKSAEEPAMQDDADDPKRRAAERINKLRNLSFNINAADPNNEFETVPAYIRRNLELYNTISNVENFYSNYEVKTDENNNTEISTINTFLDGKRPD